jgi:hypothetical protein
LSPGRSAAGALGVLLSITSACGVRSTSAPDPDRTVLADGSRVYVSPERKATDGWYPARPSQLWAKPQGDAPARQLTFGSASVADPVVLDDGRVLFVSAMPKSPSSPETRPLRRQQRRNRGAPVRVSARRRAMGPPAARARGRDRRVPGVGLAGRKRAVGVRPLRASLQEPRTASGRSREGGGEPGAEGSCADGAPFDRRSVEEDGNPPVP